MAASSASPEDDDNSTVYQDASTNDLTILTSALLLTADCMGTGILALPADVQTLGQGFGLAFLIFNLPVNLYAGTILSWSALFVEEKILHDSHEGGELELTNDDRKKRKGYSSVHDNENDHPASIELESHEVHASDLTNTTAVESIEHEWNEGESISAPKHQRHTDTATFDFVSMTSILFDEPILLSNDESTDKDANNISEEPQQKKRHRSTSYNHPATKLVLFIYYMNLFLVLGNYILVMSHAVSAMAGEDNLCIPTAGIIASTIMLGLSQLRTMANLGRSVSFTSLLALFVVVIQCLYALRNGSDNSFAEENSNAGEDAALTATERILSKFSSIAAIGFAVGSQKLLLNIRHEMSDRTKSAPQSLSIALSLYGFAYIVVCLLAGPTPPSFLFDAIPIGTGRRMAGFLLWVHVAVSYAINSQALCSSLDRMMAHSAFGKGVLAERHRTRWFILTASVATTSFFVANSVPFFKVSCSL